MHALQVVKLGIGQRYLFISDEPPPQQPTSNQQAVKVSDGCKAWTRVCADDMQLVNFCTGAKQQAVNNVQYCTRSIHQSTSFFRVQTAAIQLIRQRLLRQPGACMEAGVASCHTVMYSKAHE